MWCLVSQANSVILEVQVDPRAIGQECLEKNLDETLKNVSVQSSEFMVADFHLPGPLQENGPVNHEVILEVKKEPLQENGSEIHEATLEVKKEPLQENGSEIHEAILKVKKEPLQENCSEIHKANLEVKKEPLQEKGSEIHEATNEIKNENKKKVTELSEGTGDLGRGQGGSGIEVRGSGRGGPGETGRGGPLTGQRKHGGPSSEGREYPPPESASNDNTGRKKFNWRLNRRQREELGIPRNRRRPTRRPHANAHQSQGYSGPQWGPPQQFQACNCLGISKECDYFGLKYQNAKGEELWLNLRNPIDRQTGGGVAPLRFALRVKFWVPPHLLLQEATRHQFYLHSRLELVEGRLKVSDWTSVPRLVALIAQADAGDYDALSLPHGIYSQCCQIQPSEPCEPKPQDFLHRIVQQHKEIKGMKASTAEYWLLKEVSNLDTFGQEMFHSKFGANEVSMIGVGPHGITVYRGQGDETQNIPYTAIQSATSQRRMFHLIYLSLDGEETSLDFKLDSSQSASGLYRAITEKHAFYSCETVRSAVTAQFIRDLKGTIISIFNVDSTLGKKYVFDIRRTCREVYDNARRALYCEAANIALPEESEILERHDCGDCENPKCKESRACLAKLLDAMLCRICMDRSLDTALFPCGHAVACLECARRCERCPLCRADIDHCRTIYLPIELTHVDKLNLKLSVDNTAPSFNVKQEPEDIMRQTILRSESSVNHNHNT